MCECCEATAGVLGECDGPGEVATAMDCSGGYSDVNFAWVCEVGVVVFVAAAGLAFGLELDDEASGNRSRGCGFGGWS
jgi:hypothetical protein